MNTPPKDAHSALPDPAAASSHTKGGWRRNLRSNTQTMLVLVICCGLSFWAVRVVWEMNNPLARVARALDQADASTRLIAVRELERSDDTAAIPLLVSRLDDSDARLRAAAAAAIGTIVAQPKTAKTLGADEAHAVATKLLATLRDEAASARFAAAMALRSLAASKQPQFDFERAAGALVERLDDPDVVVRREAVGALAVIGPMAADDPPPRLVAALEDPDKSVRETVVNALGRYIHGRHRLVPALIRRIERDGPEVRESELAVLRLLQPVVTGTTPATLRPQPGSFAPEDVSTLIAALRSGEPAVRCVAARNLGLFFAEARSAVPALVETLTHSLHSPLGAAPAGASRSLRYDPAAAAAEALGRIAQFGASLEAILALREALRSPRVAPRDAAATALGQFGPAAAVTLPDLITALRETLATEEPASDSEDSLGTVPFTGYWIAEAIGQIAEKEESSAAVAALADAMAAKSARTREGAANAFLSLAPNSKIARARLRALLRHPDQGFRIAAESILKKVGRDSP
jgi:HEAT repeat protein